MYNEHAPSEIHSKEGFAAAVLQYERLLFAISYSALGNVQQCPDAIQAALLKAWNKRRSLRDPAKLKSWLGKIVLHECRNLQRKRRDVELSEEQSAVPSVDEQLKLDVRRAISKLSVKQRVPVVLYYLEGYSVEEISEILRIPKGTVSSLLFRARNDLRKELKEYDSAE